MNFNELTFNWAFPVGTGIYRRSEGNLISMKSVPCGYRDIPIQHKNGNIADKRSLWVQGYTGLAVDFKSSFGAFPVGTEIYRRLPINKLF